MEQSRSSHVLQASAEKQQLGAHLQLATPERQLDFNAPILSVRRLNGGQDGKRFGRRATMPSNPLKFSSELGAEPLRTPGGVPFLWEQSPGRAKNKGKEEVMQAGPPALPPGRPPAAALPKGVQDRGPNVGSPKQHMDLEHAAEAADSGSDWKRQHSSERKSLATLFNQGSRRYTTGHPSEVSIPSKAKTSAPSPRQLLSPSPSSFAKPSTEAFFPRNLRLASSSLLQLEGSSPAHDMDNEDTFSDAADTLAPTEAATDIYLVSLDGNDRGQDLRQTGSEARDFIMNRFLPAAQAMACDSPQVMCRRPVQEALSSPVIDGRLFTSHHLPPRPRPTPIRERVLPTEEDDERDMMPLKLCGLFSARLKNAFGHLNRSSHTPQCKSKKNGPSPVSRSRTLEDIMYEDALSTRDYEVLAVREVQADLQVRRAQMMQHTASLNVYPCAPGNATGYRGSPYHHQHMLEGGQTPNERTIYYDAFSRSPQTPDRFTGAYVTPYRNEAPMSPFHEGRGFLGLPKEWSTDRPVPVEGTSHFDETPRASVSVDKNDYSNGDDLYTPLSIGTKPFDVSQRVGKALCMDTRSDVGELRVNGSNISFPPEKVLEVVECSYLSEQHLEDSGNPRPFARLDGLEVVETTGHEVSWNPAPEALPRDGCTDIVSCEAPTREKKSWPLGVPSYINSPTRSPGQGKLVERDYSPNVISPPLPKSPSESWLWRAIPLTSSLRMRESMPAKKQLDFSPTHSTGTTWETMVKGSHLQPGHLRFSEELLHRTSNSVHVGSKP